VVSADQLSVVLVVAMSAILLGERTRQVSVGALLVAIGAFLVSLPTLPTSS
jgi:uncharacterized membrane protein